jgi:hypothetical protein
MDLADMNIAFDDVGKMMNVTKLNPDKFADLATNKKLNTFLDEQQTEVIKSDILSVA